MRRWLWPPSRPSVDAAGVLVEVRAPVDQLLDVLGGFADDHLDDVGVAERAAGDERVGDVVLEAVLGIDHAGDAALGVGAVGLLDRVLGDHEHAEAGIDGDRGPQPGDAAADDQHVGEEVRQLAGMEGDEVAGGEHGGSAECGMRSVE